MVANRPQPRHLLKQSERGREMLRFPFFSNPRLPLARYPVSFVRRFRNELPPPEAAAFLERWDYNELKWVVRRCPLCRRQHVHGAGLVGDDPRKALGHRVRHCFDRDLRGSDRLRSEIPSGYIVIDSDPDRTLRMMRGAT